MPEFPGRLRTPRLPSAPSSPSPGEMYYDTVTNILYWWNGTAWTSASGGSAAPEVYISTDQPSPRVQQVLWVDTDSIAAPPAGAPTGPTLVTSLPSFPGDGQEIYYIADATNGVIWHLRYRSAVTGPYKWEFVGGTPFMANVATLETITADGTYRDTATAGPDFTVPLAGDYRYEFFMYGVGGSGAGVLWTGLVLGAGATPATPHEVISSIGATPGRTSESLAQKMTGLTAGQLLRMRYAMSGGGTGNVGSRSLAVQPVRVG